MLLPGTHFTDQRDTSFQGHDRLQEFLELRQRGNTVESQAGTDAVRGILRALQRGCAVQSVEFCRG